MGAVLVGEADLVRPHVFMHASWRTSSTWLWQKMRVLPGVTAYYEPFHEILATVTAGSLEALRPDSWDSGHPSSDNPYFEEYRAVLQPAGGVSGFLPEFSYLCYSTTPAAYMEAQRAYLQGLIKAAESDGKAALLAFCRSSGRTDWMVETFPGVVHILQKRSPWGQFQSYVRQATEFGNAYFLVMQVAILCAAPPGSDFVQIRSSLGLPDLSGADAAALYAETASVLRGCSLEQLYTPFMVVYAYCLWRSRCSVDYVLDVDRLASDDHYRGEAQRWFAARACLDVSMDDIRLPVAAPPGWDWRTAHEAVYEWLQSVAGDDLTHSSASSALLSDLHLDTSASTGVSNAVRRSEAAA